MASNTVHSKHHQLTNNVVNKFNFNQDVDETNSHFLSAFWDTCPTVIGVSPSDISIVVLIRSIINDRKQAAINGDSTSVPFGYNDPQSIVKELDLLSLKMKIRCHLKSRKVLIKANMLLGGLSIPLLFVSLPAVAFVGLSLATINTKSFINWLMQKSELYQFYRSYFYGFQVNHWLQSIGFTVTPRAVKNYEMLTQFSFFNNCKQPHLVKLGTQKILGYTVKVFNVFCLSNSGINHHHLCFSVDLKSNVFSKPTQSTFCVESIGADISIFPQEASYDSHDAVLPTPMLEDTDGHKYNGSCSDFISFSDKNTFDVLNTLQSHQPNQPFSIQKTETHLYFALPIAMLNLANFDDNFEDNKFNLISSNEPINSALISLIRLCSKSKSLMEI